MVTINPLMKIPFALFVLILTLGAGLSWSDSQRFAAVRKHHTQLVAQAVAIGISPEPSHRDDSFRASKHDRETQKVTAIEVLTEFTAFVKDMKASGKTLDSLGEAGEQGLEKMMARVDSLDPAQMKILIAEACAAKDCEEGLREYLLDHALSRLAEDDPQKALALFAELPDLLKDSTDQKGSLVWSSLHKWAKGDPTAAVEWVRKNAAKFPERVTRGATEGVIAGIAATDPKLAFKVYDELGCTPGGMELYNIVTAAETPENWTVTLSAIRDYFATSPQGKRSQELMSNFTGNLARKGFTPSTEWIAGAGLTPAELETTANSLILYIKPRETGQWVEWVGKQLPTGKSEGAIREMVEVWTQRDYQAAGKWLATTPASPTKNAAIRSYAETVSKYDPTTATQWAMTLPPGPDRDKTLKHIQDHPPAK